LGNPFDEKRRVVPRKPHPINNIFRKMKCIRCNQMPPSGRCPKWDNNSSFDILCHKFPPYFAYKAERSINPTIIAAPIKTKSVHARSIATPMERIEDLTKIVLVRRKEVNGMRTPHAI
jgi:hypothetical protein